MADISVFIDKEITPTEHDLKVIIGDTYAYWQTIYGYVFEKYPKGKSEWNYPGKKYGWSFRIKDKRRAIIYFLPREGYFKVAFVFGQKAYDEIMDSSIHEIIKKDLREARKYAEGRGVIVEVKSESVLEDIYRLVEFKLAY